MLSMPLHLPPRPHFFYASPRDHGNVCWPLTDRQDHRGGRKRRARIRPRGTAGQMPRAKHKPKAAPRDPKTGAKNNFTKLRSGKKLDKPDNLGFNVASATDEELPPGVNGADGLKPAGDDAARERASATLRGSGLDTADAAQISCQLLPDGSHSYRRWRALLTCLLLLGVFCACAGAHLPDSFRRSTPT